MKLGNFCAFHIHLEVVERPSFLKGIDLRGQILAHNAEIVLTRRH